MIEGVGQKGVCYSLMIRKERIWRKEQELFLAYIPVVLTFRTRSLLVAVLKHILANQCSD